MSRPKPFLSPWSNNSATSADIANYKNIGDFVSHVIFVPDASASTFLPDAYDSHYIVLLGSYRRG